MVVDASEASGLTTHDDNPTGKLSLVAEAHLF